MMYRLWRIVPVCLIVAALCWHPGGYAGGTEPPPEAQSPPSTQDVYTEEEPGDASHHPKVPPEPRPPEVSHALPPREDEEPPAEGEPADDELMKRDQPENDQQPAAEPQALEAEEPPEEAEPEPASESEPERESQPEQQLLPEASVTQDQGPAPTYDPSPPPPGPASPTAQDSSPDAVSEQVEAEPVLDLSDADVDSADCDLSSVPVVLENTSNVHCGGTKSDMDPAPGPPALGPGNASHSLEDQGLSSIVSTETDPGAGARDPEDMTTFDEWKRKVMEVEKEKTLATHASSNRASHVVKKPQKNFNNYASVECGAKILGANPEAKSTSAILMENMDLYMLNPCSNKIWFVIELCEPIQLKQLDIANFELFSSTPKDFLVSISDRYPTNKWLKLGTFHGRDERTVQSFPLDEHLYAKYIKMFTKYIKVELLSHFGSEHFCPFSLIRVFGTSMVEEYEEIADPSERADDQDDYFDYPPGYVPPEDKSSHNLIGSAKDVILNMVNNIAGSWGGPDNGNFTGQALNVTETSASSQLDPTDAPTPPLETADSLDQRPDDVQEDPGVAAVTDEAPPPPEQPPIPAPPPSDAPPPPPDLPPAEEEPVATPPEEEEDYPPVVLLDPEEEEEEGEEEEREREREREREEESLDYGGGGLTPPPACCCSSASLREYLLQRCSALPATPRKPGREETPGSKKKEKKKTKGEESGSETPPPAPALAPDPAPQEPQDSRDPPAAGPPEESDRRDLAAPPEPPPPPPPRPPQLEPSQTTTTSSSSTSAPEPEPESTPPTPTLALGPSSSSSVADRLPPTPSDPQPLPETRSQEVPAEGEEPILNPTPTPTIIIISSISAAPVDRVWEPPLADEAEQPPPGPETDLPHQQPHTPTDVSVSPPTGPGPAPTEPPPAPPSEPAIAADNAPAEEDEPHSDCEVADPPPKGVSTETKEEELADDLLSTASNGNGQLLRPSSSSSSSSSSSQSDFYAELHNATEMPAAVANGNPTVHGTNQKESVFMRLNNRIKALEVNMSLSGRYLEQLSQRYRKQMEEMQRAFNKTIIKLQNTSRIAEEQDQRQTESIQTLHGQLNDITELVLNLSVRVSLLQSEVSDRQSYLLLCLVLGLVLGLVLCAQHCRISALPPSPSSSSFSSDPDHPSPDSYSYCFPDRTFPSYDEPSLKRSASYPLLSSDPLQLPAAEGPESLHTVEPHRLNRRKKRGRTKAKDKVETLKSSAVVSAPPLANGGALLSNGVPRGMDPSGGLGRPPPPSLGDLPSPSSLEGSSEGSSHSDEPSFCGIATACTRLCDGVPPPPRSRAGRRRRHHHHPKPAAAGVMADPTRAPRTGEGHAPTPVLLDRMRASAELGSGSFGAKAPSGPV